MPGSARTLPSHVPFCPGQRSARDSADFPLNRSRREQSCTPARRPTTTTCSRTLHQSPREGTRDTTSTDPSTVRTDQEILRGAPTCARASLLLPLAPSVSRTCRSPVLQQFLVVDPLSRKCTSLATFASALSFLIHAISDASPPRTLLAHPRTAVAQCRKLIMGDAHGRGERLCVSVHDQRTPLSGVLPSIFKLSWLFAPFRILMSCGQHDCAVVT